MNVAVRRYVEDFIKTTKESADWSSHRLGFFQHHRAERWGERQRVESRQQYGDGNRQSKLPVHTADETAEERHRDKHSRQNQRDANNRSRHLRHCFIGRLFWRQSMFEVMRSEEHTSELQ